MEKPHLYLFDQNTKTSWFINADQAKWTLENNKVYLYNQVEINNLNPNASLSKLTADEIVFSLPTQDIVSQGMVKLHGKFLESIGYGLQGNLKKRHLSLINNVKTRYVFPKH